MSRSFIPTVQVVVCVAFLVMGEVVVRGDGVVADLFGRDVSTFGLTVPDWEGYMANPAIQFTVTPPSQASWPLTVTLSTVEPRLYFDLPSEALAEGARKTLVFKSSKPQSVYVAVFPAREKKNVETSLAILMVDGRGRKTRIDMPIHIVAIASQDHSVTFPITVDFSQDKTGFYNDAGQRAVFQQAAADWAFYLQDMKVQPVGAGREKTRIFEPSGFVKSNDATNAKGYSGFLLYAYGINGPELRSGGEPSDSDFQHDAAGGSLPIRRSGGVETEILGNYNKLGWMPSAVAEQQWWRATNLGDVPNDLYSIVHHEMAHALFFNPANRKFPRNEVLKDAAIRAYLGSDIKTDLHDHFDGFIDPVSLHGAFGNEFHGKTPYGRWLITKLDLLCAQAVGYKLRNVAALLPLSIQTESLPNVAAGSRYGVRLAAQGGIPVYDWEISQGRLPPGLTLDRFTGQISGAASHAGDYVFTVKVRDYDAASVGVTKEFHIRVGG